MFARISFDEHQVISSNDLEQLDNFLGDSVSHHKQVEDMNGTVMDYYSWSHTYDKIEAEDTNNKKTLVFPSNFVKLDSSKEYLTDVESFFSKFPKLKIKMRSMVQNSQNIMTNVVKQMKEIEDKFTRAISSFDEKIEFNQKCQVHIGNLGMLNINQLGYATDKCTEELQELLNQGWRLLAVCPQPDQRRPDYVLGRFNGEDGGIVECHNFR